MDVVPWNYDLKTAEYDGLFLSNGPGDPSMCQVTVENIREVLKQKKPIFGICLGHQLLSIAAGCVTYKMRYVPYELHVSTLFPVSKYSKQERYIFLITDVLIPTFLTSVPPC